MIKMIDMALPVVRDLEIIPEVRVVSGIGKIVVKIRSEIFVRSMGDEALVIVVVIMVTAHATVILVKKPNTVMIELSLTVILRTLTVI